MIFTIALLCPGFFPLVISGLFLTVSNSLLFSSAKSSVFGHSWVVKLSRKSLSSRELEKMHFGALEKWDFRSVTDVNFLNAKWSLFELPLGHRFHWTFEDSESSKNSWFKRLRKSKLETVSSRERSESDHPILVSGKPSQFALVLTELKCTIFGSARLCGVR